MACGGSCCGSNSAGANSAVQQAANDLEVGQQTQAQGQISAQDTVASIESHNKAQSKTEAPACEKSCCSEGKATSSKSIQSDSCCDPATGTCNEPTQDKKSTSSCCTSKDASTNANRNSPKDNCCAPASNASKSNLNKVSSCCIKAPTPTQVKQERKSISAASCEDSCCGGDELACEDDCCDPPDSDCTDSCCGDAEITSDADDCCAGKQTSDGCCGSDKKTANVDAMEIHSSSSDNMDLEKGGTGKEHIILSVSGMTCTGCETKLKRTLGTLSYVSNLKTSLVLARAELDIKEGAATADDVIKHLQRTTEFKCERVSNQGASLDFVCSGDPSPIVKGDWPEGVLEVTLVDKETIRVAFDAKIIGARELLEHDWARTLQLAPPRPDPTLDAGSKHVRQMGLLTLLSAILTIPVLVMAWAPLPERELAYGSASLALATIVQVVIAGPFYPKAIKALVFSKVIEMDLLIVLSTSAAYIFSVVSYGYMVAGQPLSTGEFFETSTLLVTLIMVGRWVASLARQKAAESISIRALQANTAVLVGHEKTEQEIDARMLQYGDIFKVAPDSRVPTDGTVISGASEIDESMLTGESKPVEKQVGSPVIAGSINGMGMLTVRLTRLPGDNTITTIACMVDEAKLSKPKIQDIADKVASYFVPVVVALTIITFLIWVAIGIAVRNQSGSEAVIEAITYAITVLIVSCPCAIGLAVPMVIVVASGVAASRGVIFKSAESIEIAYKTTDVVFDKTGTLTEGKLAVVDEAYLGDDTAQTQSLLLGLVTGIKHPVSFAIATHLTGQGVAAKAVRDTKAVAGKGVEGNFKDEFLRAGNSRWLHTSSMTAVQSMLAKGLTAFCFTIDKKLVAVLGLQDTLRPDALNTISQLQRRGLNVHILSGDDDGAVQNIATELNIPTDTVRSRCSPSDKAAYIKDLLATKSRPSKKAHKPVVMFVGDGTNDAVALAQATVGVHVSSGTDIAQSAADVVLVRSDLACVLTLINVSRKAMHRVAFNFGWSFVYNLFAVLLGAGAFVNARIPPEYAGLGELVSVLPVIAAAVLLRWAKI
ncbi:E1-E2 ATPase-domain-containing protein [Paraphoma chrysanthemicola]|nr:E1-E2 ATPase-domain-containing protein [Paraphoma chrysanthemicola]